MSGRLSVAPLGGVGMLVTGGATYPNSRSTPRNNTAFTATMIEERDIKSADHSGRSIIP